MYVRPISERLLSGRLTPAIRATTESPLTLLVTLVLADHQNDAVAADDLALLAHRLDRRSYLHDPFRTGFRRLGSGCRCGRRYRVEDVPLRAKPARTQAGHRIVASSIGRVAERATGKCAGAREGRSSVSASPLSRRSRPPRRAARRRTGRGATASARAVPRR